MSELPKGWAEVTLADLGNWVGGGTPSKSNPYFWKGIIPWVSPKDIKKFYIEDAKDHITEEAISQSATILVPKGSILLVIRSGILAHSLPVALTTCDVAINQDLKALIPKDELNAKYIAVIIEFMSRKILSNGRKSGTTVHSIDFKTLKQTRLWLAPAPEQRRIVMKLDTLTNRTAKARVELGRVPVLVEHYRQAVLAAAFRGELTRDWRKLHSKSMPGSWSYVDWSHAGETLSGRAFPSIDYSRTGVKLLRPGNLHISGAVEWTNENTVFLSFRYAEKFPNYFLRGSHILINLTAQSLKDQFLGRTCLSNESDSFLLNQRIAMFKPYNMSKKYCLFVLKSPLFRKFVDTGLNSGSLIQHIHIKQLKTFVFPVPSRGEQAEIVRLIEHAFTEIDRLASEAASARHLLDRLDQAILAKAFRGELVPQDPSDEPASVLLKRIRTEQTESGVTGRSRRIRSRNESV